MLFICVFTQMNPTVLWTQEMRVCNLSLLAVAECRLQKLQK